MNATSFLRLWRTVRHLKPVQVYGRLWFRMVRPRPDLSPPPNIRALSGTWITPATRRASLVSPGEFSFIGQTGTLDEVGWDGSERNKLWRYNQHYFDDLNAEGAVERTAWHQALLEDWVQRNPPGQGTGWEPYPTSLRIVNWVKWALAGHELPSACRHSLAVQARWLMRRLEHHLQGNHLFANAKALVFAGLFFKGDEAESWLRRGESILLRQFPEQILPDGGHFELSTMYHALALEDVLDLINLFTVSGVEEPLSEIAKAVVPDMLRWLNTMCHPDGQIAFFNDAAFGITPDPVDLLAYAKRLGFPAPKKTENLTWLPDSGYVRLESGPAVLLADLARIGPDYLPGHAHADTLSFELSLFGRRVVVNSGTSEYGSGPERLRQRGTSAHSTVTVAGQNSSEVWGGFRVARRARPFDVFVPRASSKSITIAGSHDGYHRLHRAPTHRRIWTLGSDSLVIEDRVTPPVDAEARYLLAPGLRLSLTSGGAGIITLETGHTVQWSASGGGVRIEEASWHPEFGQTIPTKCLVVPLENGEASLTMDWT